VGPLRASRCGPPSGRRVGAVARLRTSTATSAGGIVVRYESGQPSLVVGSRRANGTAEPGPSPRERPTPARAARRPRSARSRRRPDSGSASPDRSTPSNTGSSSRARASTRPSTIS
jgi:hypothetical protein